MSQRLQAADWHLEAPGRELATYLLSEADDRVGAIVTNLALLLLLLSALAPLLDRPLRRVVADPVLPVAVLAAALLAAAAATAAAADDSDGWQRAAAAVLGVLVAVTAGSHVVRAVFRLTRREYRLVRAGRARPGVRPPRHRRPGTAASWSWRRRARCSRAAPGSATSSAAPWRPPCWPSFPEGLALVLAVKGVGRYPELRDSGRGGRARVRRAGGVHHRHAGQHALGRRRCGHGDAAPLTTPRYRDPAVPLLRCPSCAS